MVAYKADILHGLLKMVVDGADALICVQPININLCLDQSTYSTCHSRFVSCWESSYSEAGAKNKFLLRAMIFSSSCSADTIKSGVLRTMLL